MKKKKSPQARRSLVKYSEKVMGKFCQDIPLKCFRIFTLAFIVPITQYALFIKDAGYTVVGSKLPFKPSINEQVLKLPKKGRIWRHNLSQRER